MLGIGSVSGSGDAASALYSLLDLISNPDAARKRLDALVAEAKKAQSLYDQAQATRAFAEQLSKTTATKQIEGQKVLDQQAKKEADLKGREQKLADKDVELVRRENELAVAKVAFVEQSKTTQEDHEKRERAIQATAAENARALAEQKALLASEHSSKLAAVTAQKSELSKKLAEAEAALAAAEQKKVIYDTRVAALQKAVQGDGA